MLRLLCIFLLLFNVFSLPLMVYVLGILGRFCQNFSPDVLGEVVTTLWCVCLFNDYFIIYVVKILRTNHLCFPFCYSNHSIPPVFNHYDLR